MSVFITGSGLITDKFSIADNVATVVLDVDSSVTVVQIKCVERGAMTPTLTVDVHDGTDTYYLRNALAMTAKQEVNIDGPIELANDEALRVTSNHASGLIDVFVTYFSPSATGRA
jgi:hypothetical protein